MDSWAEYVRRGRDMPYCDAYGKQINLSHAEQFGIESVKTDGLGNILAMPLLARKPCFARPDIVYRKAYEEKEFTSPSGKKIPQPTRCQTCPVLTACKFVSAERIKSDGAIANAFVTWSKDYIGLRSMMKDKAHRNSPEWDAFLDAIIAHGPWSNVNDAQVYAHERERAYNREQSKRDSAKAKRTAKTQAKRTGRLITPEFTAVVQSERDKRHTLLLNLRAIRTSPRWITKLSAEGCEMTADVWMACKHLSHSGVKFTGKEIAEWLIANDRCQKLILASLGTRAVIDRKRCKLLESGGLWDYSLIYS